MTDPVFTILASEFSTTEIIWAAVVIVIMIGSWIANRLKGTEDQPTSGGADDAESGDVRVEELAARRREQLRRMAQRRQDEQSSPVDQAESQPQNLTLAERIERARARAQYDKRAKSMRQQSSGPQTGQGRPQQAPAQRQPVDRSTTTVTPTLTPAPAPIATPRKASSSRPAVRPPLRQTRRRWPAASAEPSVPDRRPRATRSPPEPVISHSDPPLATATSVRTAPVATAPPLRSASGFLGDRRSLKKAIVLKEILDRPLALRPDAEPSW